MMSSVNLLFEKKRKQIVLRVGISAKALLYVPGPVKNLFTPFYFQHVHFDQKYGSYNSYETQSP